MNEAYTEHLAKVREQARLSCAKALRSEVKAKRLAERRLRREGEAPPFSALTWADVEKLRADGSYDELASNESFRQRVEYLEGERAAAADRIRQAEDQATILALETASDELRLAHEHEKQRRLFLVRHGLQEIDKALPQVKESYRRLVRDQQNELEQLRARL